MKKITLLLFSAVLFINTTVLAQPSIDKIPGLISFDDQLIKAALDSVFFIVRQDYVLRYTRGNIAKDFGRGGNEYFGRVYGLVVLSENKFWADGRLKTPWLLDENYRDFQSVDTLIPVLTNTSFRRISEKSFKKYNVIIKDSSKSDYFYYETMKDLRSVSNNPNTKDSMGWLVIAYTKDDIQHNDSCDVYLFPFRPRPQYKNNSYAPIKMPQKEYILGGGYFTVNISVGQIRFSYAGVLYKKAQNWLISLIAAPVKKEELNEIKNEDSEEKPIKKGRK